MRTTRPISVTLGNLEQSVTRRVNSGAYASASEVVRAGLRALEREEAVLDEIMKAKIQEALDDPRPDVPADEVFARLRARHASKVKALPRGA